MATAPMQQYRKAPQALPQEPFNAQNDEHPNAAQLFQELLDDALDKRLRTTHIEQDTEVCRIRKRVNGRLDEVRIESTQLTTDLICYLQDRYNIDDALNTFKIHETHRSVVCQIECLRYQTTTGAALTIRISHPRNIPDSLEQTTLSLTSVHKLRDTASQQSNGVTVVTSPSEELLCDLYYALLAERQNLDTMLLSFEAAARKQIPRVNHITTDYSADLQRFDADHIFIDWERCTDPELVNALLERYPSATLFIKARNSAYATRQLTDIAMSERQLATNLAAFIELDHAHLICPHCAEAHQPNAPEIRIMEQHNIRASSTLNYAPGCIRCDNTGFGEHRTLLSICEVNDIIRQSIESRSTDMFRQRLESALAKESLTEQRKALISTGMMDLQALN